MAFALFSLRKAGAAMKGSLPSRSKEVCMTMASLIPDSIETGWDSHGLNSSLL